MDLVHDIASIVAEEDKISNLSDDIINRILSCVDMKDAIRTSTISRRWKYIWTTLPHLNLDTYKFRHLPQFAKFVKHALSHRNNSASVSSVNLIFTGSPTSFAVKSIIKYAFSHNVEQLTIRWDAKKSLEFPQCLFSSHTLRILSLTGMSARCLVLAESGWDFPSLEILNLTNIEFLGGTDKIINPFFKCVNLKSLYIDRLCMSKVGIFFIYAPQLCNLTIINASFPKLITLVAPQLLNLTVTPTNSSDSMLQLRTEGLSSLEKVELSLLSYPFREDDVSLLLDMFHMFCSATVLILDKNIIEAISSCLDKLYPEPSPFNNLKCLKVHGVSCYPTRAKNYLLENSPNATFIMDSPQVPQKRSREVVPNDAMANKVAKLEAENEQADTTDIEKRTLKAKITQGEAVAKLCAKIRILETKLQYEKLIPHILEGKMEELKLQIESGNPDYEAMHSIKCEIRSLKSLISYNQDGELCRQRELEKIETQLGFLTDSKRVYSNNILIRSDVLTIDPTSS